MILGKKSQSWLLSFNIQILDNKKKSGHFSTAYMLIFFFFYQTSNLHIHSKVHYICRNIVIALKIALHIWHYLGTRILFFVIGTIICLFILKTLKGQRGEHLQVIIKLINWQIFWLNFPSKLVLFLKKENGKHALEEGAILTFCSFLKSGQNKYILLVHVLCCNY